MAPLTLPLRPLATARPVHSAHLFQPFTVTISSHGPSLPHRRKAGKLARRPPILPVRLLRDVSAFGPVGSIVPTTLGQMRNQWFPRQLAAYLPPAELRQHRLGLATAERDFDFDVAVQRRKRAAAKYFNALQGEPVLGEQGLREASMFQRTDLEAGRRRLGVERCAELVKLFVPRRLDFFRQGVLEEEVEVPAVLETPAPPLPKSATQREERRRRGVSSAADDLMDARSEPLPPVARPGSAEMETPGGAQPPRARAIYGSVSRHDVLVAVRAAMSGNEEAARAGALLGGVQFTRDLISSVAVGVVEGTSADKVEYVGEFEVDISIKGDSEVEEALTATRVVRVIEQEAA